MSLSDQLCEDLVWCHEVEHLAWPVVEAFGDFVEAVLAVPAEVGALAGLWFSVTLPQGEASTKSD